MVRDRLKIIFVNESDYLAGGRVLTPTAKFPPLCQQLPNHLHPITALAGVALCYPPDILDGQSSPVPSILARAGGDGAKVLWHSGEHVRLPAALDLPQL